MKISLKTAGLVLVAFFAIAIGLYPIAYLVSDMRMGLLATKPEELLSSRVWNALFHVHIFFGGLSLLAGWSQFIKKIRNKNLGLHRVLGKVYIICVVLSGGAGLYIALYATGGIISVLGFTSLAVAWLATSIRAYVLIRNKRIDDHERWMIRSFALTFAAVTLRLWLPLMDFAMGMDFFDAYRIVAWLCWVPNVLVAEAIIMGMLRGKQVVAS